MSAQRFDVGLSESAGDWRDAAGGAHGERRGGNRSGSGDAGDDRGTEGSGDGRGTGGSGRSRGAAGSGGGSASQSAPGTTSEILAELDEVAVLPAHHPLAARPVLEPRDFEGQAFVSLAAADPYRRQFDAIFSEANVERRMQIETHSAMAVCALVQQGLGIALVNPLTAWACASQATEAGTPSPASGRHSAGAALTGAAGLVVRRFSIPVPFRIQVLRPLHRPRQALADDFIAAVREVLDEVASSSEPSETAT
ncbi:hypothetical protein CDN98_21325 [Roseateles terrae]|nr:hypothetical protein CDN98_21325 [Roseateles terrae]